jgi:hypothetical protein
MVSTVVLVPVSIIIGLVLGILLSRYLMKKDIGITNLKKAMYIAIPILTISFSINFIGNSLNNKVISSNGGKMPIDYNLATKIYSNNIENIVNSKHILTSKNTKYYFLCDRFYVGRVLSFHAAFYSLGDILECIALILWYMPLSFLFHNQCWIYLTKK